MIQRIGNGGIVPPWLQAGNGGMPRTAGSVAPFDWGQFAVVVEPVHLRVLGSEHATSGNEGVTVLVGQRDGQFTRLGEGL